MKSLTPPAATAYLIAYALICCGAHLDPHTVAAQSDPNALRDPVAQNANPPELADSAAEPVLGEDAAEAPYIVFVAGQQVHARCGPGKEHYQTDPLRRGQELEVYLETGDGWLGIRPPAKSFSWLPEEAIQGTSKDASIAIVKEDKTVVWIGTQLGEARSYQWQIQLNAGEHVSILNRIQRSSKNGQKNWLQIVPPSGEFRWIHREDIVESAEDLAGRIASDSRAAEQTLVPKRVQIAAADGGAVAGDLEILQAGDLQPIPRAGKTIAKAMTAQSTRRLAGDGRLAGENGLRQMSGMPDLVAAPGDDKQGGDLKHDEVPDSLNESSDEMESRLADRAFQFHRDADVNEFADRGAVVGSGLRKPWRDSQTAGTPSDESFAIAQTAAVDDGTRSVLDRTPIPTAGDSPSGAKNATETITAPLRKVTDFVANFISPPRVIAIGSAPNRMVDANPSDRRWLVGSDRESKLPFDVTPPVSLAENPIQQVSATMPKSRVVDVTKISRVADQAAGADATTLNALLSRLMSEAASAPEMDPLIRRTEVLLEAGDYNQATRLRHLLQQATQYRHIAERRDGATTISSAAHPTSNSGADDNGLVSRELGLKGTLSVQPPLPSTPIPALSPTPVNETRVGSASGFLVQVYSARPNSPPYALTDEAGLTVAYVTPYPGVNLRNHLNSRIAVRGNEKLLQGMSTPHILVDRAERR